MNISHEYSLLFVGVCHMFCTESSHGSEISCEDTKQNYFVNMVDLLVILIFYMLQVCMFSTRYELFSTNRYRKQLEYES